jgi:hypothetical protein
MLIFDNRHGHSIHYSLLLVFTSYSYTTTLLHDKISFCACLILE